MPLLSESLSFFSSSNVSDQFVFVLGFIFMWLTHYSTTINKYLNTWKKQSKQTAGLMWIMPGYVCMFTGRPVNSQSTASHWATEKYEIKYRRKDEGQETNAEPFPSPTATTKKMNNKGKEGKTNGILARGRAIRDENKQLPLISPDRNKPCPFSLTAQSQKGPNMHSKTPHTHSLTHFCNSEHSHQSWRYLKTFFNCLFIYLFIFCHKGTIQIYLVPLWRHWNIQRCSACRLESQPCMTQNSAHLRWNADSSEESSEVKPSGRHAAKYAHWRGNGTEKL